MSTARRNYNCFPSFSDQGLVPGHGEGGMQMRGQFFIWTVWKIDRDAGTEFHLASPILSKYALKVLLLDM